MPLDVSGLSYFMPVFSFLLVTVLVYALLLKTKILGESKFISLLVAFILAVIFISFSSVRRYVVNVTPWVVVLFIAIFFIVLIVGFSQNKIETFMKPGFAWVFIILLILIFLIAALKVFSGVLGPYLPGGSEVGADPFLLRLKHFFGSSKFLGALAVLVVAALTTWVLTKK